MGTRGLTCVQIDKQYRVAQYGQWDHYPSGQGVTILEFLKKKGNLDLLESKSRLCRFLTEADVKELDNLGPGEWKTVAPQLSRDVGGEILQMIADSEKGLGLQNQIDFAADGLFCEWAYVVDFDSRSFEVYKGFGQSPLKDKERFKYLEDKVENDYSPVNLVKKYSLDSLPSKTKFLKDFKGEEDE